MVNPFRSNTLLKTFPLGAPICLGETKLEPQRLLDTSHVNTWNKEKRSAREFSCTMIFMRKTLMWSLGPCLLAMACVCGQAQDNSEAAKVRALENKLMDAYKQRQVEVFATLLDDDFVITFEDGSTYSKTGYLSYTASGSLRVELSEMSDVKIRLHGNTAIVTGAYHERGDFKGEPFDDHDRFTDVWMKEEGKWRLVASHYGIPLKR